MTETPLPLDQLHQEVIVASMKHLRIENVYDYLLTLEHEVNLVWNAPWGIMNLMYILARYVPFIMIGMIDRIASDASATRCKSLYLLTTWSLFIGMGAAEGLWVGVVVATSRFLDSMEFVLQKPLRPVLHGCLITSAKSNLLIIDWGLLFVFDAVNLGLMLVPAYYSFKEGSSNLSRHSACMVKMRFSSPLPHSVHTAVYLVSLTYIYVGRTDVPPTRTILCREDTPSTYPPLHYIVAVASANIVVASSAETDYSPLLVELGRVLHSVFACRVVLQAREEARKTEIASTLQ
ncbi:hypothetical protein BDQ17DRAFT_1404612 [Cyathus striatus]|nr:hypothetical protein BDQ17DRAFT_1404612 [Cyathus striatus]